MSMDIEDLNKSQIILLTLLVSFVTSIATGIVTVSLMEKAPKDVVRVTQKVVERVVEKVGEANPIKQDEPAVEKIIEKTVVVKEGDLIAQAIAENRSKLLALYESDTNTFAAFALPISKDLLVTDYSKIDPNKKYYAKNSNSDIFPIEYLKGGGTRKLAMFKLLSDEAEKRFRVINLAESDPQLGQSVFLFTSPDFSSVAQGIVSQLKNSFIYVDVSEDKIMPGTVVFNSSAEVVGISTGASRGKSQNAFVSYLSISAFKDSPKEDLEKENDNNASSTDASLEDKLESGENDSAATSSTENTQSNNSSDSTQNNAADNTDTNQAAAATAF